MNRQQRRASHFVNTKAKEKTYTFTKKELQLYINQAVEKELKNHDEKITINAINEAMILLLTLPLEVLMDHYWKKSYQRKIPEFTNYVLEYYKKWQDGEIDMNKLKEDLWKYGNVRLEVEK